MVHLSLRVRVCACVRLCFALATSGGRAGGASWGGGCELGMRAGGRAAGWKRPNRVDGANRRCGRKGADQAGDCLRKRRWHMEAVSGGAGPRSGAGTARAPADGLVAGLVTPGGHPPQAAAAGGGAGADWAARWPRQRESGAGLDGARGGGGAVALGDVRSTRPPDRGGGMGPSGGAGCGRHPLST
jgi:hypothetical protein